MADDIQKMLIALILVVLGAFALYSEYLPILFVSLFFGFYKIILMNPKYESLRERFESIF